MLESAPQQVDTHEEDHHLEPSSQSEIWEVYGIRYTVIYSQKDICKIKILVLTLWMLPHVSCFAAVLPCKCHEQKALKKLRPCEVPHRFRDLIVGRCHFFSFTLFFCTMIGLSKLSKDWGRGGIHGISSLQEIEDILNSGSESH